MTDPDWVVEGIEWAERVGGVALEVYTKPGFTGGQKAVRPYTSGGGSAFESTDSEGLWWIEAGTPHTAAPSTRSSRMA